MSTKLFIGTLMFYIIAQILCNIVDGNDMITNSNTADIGGLSTSSVTMSSDTSNTPAQYVSMGGSFFTTVGKLVFFDFSIFRNTDGTPNDWVVLRYLLMAIGLLLLVEAALVFRQIVAG